MPARRKSIDVESAAKMYLGGATLAQIADHLGVASLTVKKRLLELGIAMRRPGPRDATTAQAASRRLTDNQEQDVARRYEAGELAYEIAASVGVGRKTISNALRRQGVQTRDKRESQAHMNRRRRERGERHPNFKGGRIQSAGGYVLVSVADDDPMFEMAKDRGRLSNFGYGYVLEHRYVMAHHLGRPLLSEETVHHRNGKRDDNRLSNLELWSSRHAKGQRVEDLREFAKEILALYPD